MTRNVADRRTRTRDEYDSFARWYDAVLGMPLGQVRRGIKTLAAPLKDASIVDIGCGTGALLCGLDADAAVRCGVDRSLAMLAQNRQALHSGCCLICADARCLPFADGSFDRVIFSLVLHELEPAMRETIWREARRVLRADGFIIVADYQPRDRRGSRLVSGIIRLIERIAGRRHHAAFRNWMADGGLPGFLHRRDARILHALPAFSGNLMIARVAPHPR